jgi:predicted nucleotidyltransferase component of viral defense system
MGKRYTKEKQYRNAYKNTELMIKQWLEEYGVKTNEDAELALREIMQEIALAGLQRSGFFEKAAFYGGTALRILYGLDRFSEDLDFSLLAVDSSFSLEPYLQAIVTEFSSLGMQVSIKEKLKSTKTNVESAFLKSDTVWKELQLDTVLPQLSIGMRPSVKIKLEVDTHPPLGFATEEKLLLKPFSFYVKCFTLPDLFAGKMHALLFRKWKSRVKGRDWYDMEWYIKRGVPLNLDHFLIRAHDSGDWKENNITQQQFMTLLRARIADVSIKNVKEDVVRFIRDAKTLDIWSEKYFLDLVEKIKFVLPRQISAAR